MCGIVGFSSEKKLPLSFLMEGLKRLEYRGYDSAGIAWQSRNKLRLKKQKGFVEELWKELPPDAESSCAIAHTRWATHGPANDVNAHPQTDESGRVAVVHNGVIDNYRELRTALQDRGHVFASETDTEVVAHMIGERVDQGQSLEDGVCDVLREVEGTYGLAVIHEADPGKLVAARSGSPLIIGLGRDGSFVASDTLAMAGRAERVVHLEDGDVAVLVGKTHEIRRVAGGRSADRTWTLPDIAPSAADKRGFPHIMLKEMMEQPQALEDCFRGRIQKDSGTAHLGGLNMEPRDFLEIDRIRLLGCGTSYIAGSVGARFLTDLARIEATAEYAPEYRYSNPIVRRNTLFFALSQSGETADTLMATREIQRKGGKVLGVVNRVASTIAREAGAGVYIHAGFEYAVASTKTMLNTMMALFLLALLLGRMRDLSITRGRELINEVESLPAKIRSVLSMQEEFREAARRFAQARSLYFMGRGYSFAAAMEGALKLKEIAYVHAEAYSAAEMKHGPIALIDEEFASVFVIPRDSVYSRSLTNLQEVRARRGPVLAITTGHAGDLAEQADQVLVLPQTDEVLTPFLTIVASQFLAYESAVLRGCPVDHPKNLAKTVTVE